MVLKHRADQQQIKSFVYSWCSSCPKLFFCCCSALCFKTFAPSSLLFFTVPVTSLGPSPQSSTPCEQTFPCCTVCLVLLALGARKIRYGGSGGYWALFRFELLACYHQDLGIIWGFGLFRICFRQKSDPTMVKSHFKNTIGNSFFEVPFFLDKTLQKIY